MLIYQDVLKFEMFAIYSFYKWFVYQVLNREGIG